jgi:hypothetical protein
MANFSVSRARLVALAFASLAGLGLFYGPLFAWSPLTPGFVRSIEGRVVYLHREGRPLTAEHRAVGRAMSALEASLGLSFHGPVDVVLCDEWSDLRRFTPWLPAQPGFGARTLQFGTIAYVTPTVRDRADAGAFILHELVHVLLLRNTPLMSRLTVSRHWWLLEGLSVHFGNPHTYVVPAGDRLQRLAAQIAPILDPDQQRQRSTATVPERYALAGAFVGHLLQHQGSESLQSFLRAYLAEPSAWRETFTRHFGEPFPAALGRFQSILQNNVTIRVPRRVF